MYSLVKWSKLYLQRCELANHTPKSKTSLSLAFVNQVLLERRQDSFLFFFNVSSMTAFVLQQQSWVAAMCRVAHKAETLAKIWPFQESMFHFLSTVTQSCPTLCSPLDCSLPGSSSVCGILRARELEWGRQVLLQGIFLTQGSNPGLLHCRQTLLPSSEPEWKRNHKAS